MCLLWGEKGPYLRLFSLYSESTTPTIWSDGVYRGKIIVSISVLLECGALLCMQLENHSCGWVGVSLKNICFLVLVLVFAFVFSLFLVFLGVWGKPESVCLLLKGFCFFQRKTEIKRTKVLLTPPPPVVNASLLLFFSLLPHYHLCSS